jgi:hypothetical protein
MFNHMAPRQRRLDDTFKNRYFSQRPLGSRAGEEESTRASAYTDLVIASVCAVERKRG